MVENPQWARLQTLSPRLRDDVEIHRHRYRGRRWYVLRDALSGRWQRVNESAYRLIRLLDGERTLRTVHATIADTGAALSPEDAVSILDALNRAELLEWGVPKDALAMSERADKLRKARRLARWMSPFAIRVRLFDPDRLLNGHLGLARWLFSPKGLVLALIVLTAGAVAVATHWQSIAGYWHGRGFTSHRLLLFPLVYLVIKALHELAHGLAAKRWGGDVHETGVVLLLLVPLPYVDASSAWAFAEKYRRVMVSSAGIITELVVAAMAAIVFVSVETGLVKDLAYTTMLVGSVSTLVFNGNPLLRFDGYYVFSDLIEIPNLAPRANRYWAYLAERYLLGMREARSPVAARGERRWLFAYGIAAGLYRTAIILIIALFVAAKLPALGIAIGVWAIVAQIGVPLARKLRFVLYGEALAGRRRRALSGVGVLAVVVLASLLVIPAPLSTRAEGVVWLPEHAQVRAGADGTLKELRAAGGDFVRTGAPLASIENRLLQAQIDTLEWELREFQAQYDAALASDLVQQQILRESLTRVRADLDALREEAAALVVSSPADGKLVIPRAQHLPGRFVRKGDVIGYVLESMPPTVRVPVAQSSIGTVRGGVRAVEVRFVSTPGTSFSATLQGETPAATTALPSAALGSMGGGEFAVDTTDQRGTTATERLFLVDLRVDGRPAAVRISERALVRFEHEAEPVGYRIYRALRRLLLSRLAV